MVLPVSSILAKRSSQQLCKCVVTVGREAFIKSRLIFLQVTGQSHPLITSLVTMSSGGWFLQTHICLRESGCSLHYHSTLPNMLQRAAICTGTNPFGDNQWLHKTPALMALDLQAPLAEHHNIIHFNLSSIFDFGRREMKSVKTVFKLTAKNHIKSLR